MAVFQEIMVKEIDQEREGSGQERSDYVRKLVTQGLMVERHLKQRGIRDLIDGLTEQGLKDSTAQKTSRKKAQPTASKQIGSAEVDALCDEAEPPSSPSEEVSDTVPPSAPIESEEPAEDFVDAVLSQVDHICPNPFAGCAECEEAS